MSTLNLKNYIIEADEKGLITEIKNGVNSLKLQGLLWEIQTSDKKVVSIADADKFDFQVSDKISMAWDVCGIKVTLVFYEKDGLLKSSISVNSSAKAISRVIYPVYKGIAKITENDDKLLLPWQNGILIDNPVDNLLNIDEEVPFWMGRGGKKYENDYPAQYSYQYFTYYAENKIGYYMGIEDGNAYIKTIGVHYNPEVNGSDMVFTNYPEGMGETKFYSMPYEYTFTFYEGDWQTATRIYRKWALDQKWCTPLKERNISETVKKIDFVRINHEHYYLGTRSEEFIETCKMIKEKLDCTPAMHWYGWNKAPKHGDWYPEMADYSNKEWHDELISINQRLTEAGILKIPYVNVHLWDNHLKSFKEEGAENTLVTPEGGVIEDEPWCPERNLFAVCHATPMMKNKAMKLFNSVVTEDGFDGIYIDQVASFNATLCFDKTHGHPIGGGSWWNDEYHKMIEPLRKNMSSDKFLTTESCAESYHDLFDMFLLLDTSSQNGGFREICGCNNAESVPLFAMIYNDSSICYGSRCRFDDNNDAFEFNFVRTILWGSIPTAEGMELGEISDAEDKWAILKKGVDFYKENREVLLYGEFDEYITFNDGEKNICFGKLSRVCPGVIASVYKYNGETQVFLYNYSDSDKTVDVRGRKISVGSKAFGKEIL